MTSHDFDSLSLMTTEDRVIYHLDIKAHTIPELARLMDRNYYTVRDSVVKLVAQGLVRHVGYRKNAKVFRTVNPDKITVNESIPVVPTASNGPERKISDMLALVGTESTMASREAAVGLPRIISRLFMASLRLKSGVRFNDLPLPMIRKEIEQNIAQLKYIVTIYETILNSDVFWDERRMHALPLDPAFDKDKVVSSYRHYYED